MKRLQTFRELRVTVMIWFVFLLITIGYLSGLVVFGLVCAVAWLVFSAYNIGVRAIDGARRVIHDH